MQRRLSFLQVFQLAAQQCHVAKETCDVIACLPRVVALSIDGIGCCSQL